MVLPGSSCPIRPVNASQFVRPGHERTPSWRRYDDDRGFVQPAANDWLRIHDPLPAPAQISHAAAGDTKRTTAQDARAMRLEAVIGLA